jgi:16S rRNA (adenine1518-N6/adenine1519-N6)-dimethyltransferase
MRDEASITRPTERNSERSTIRSTVQGSEISLTLSEQRRKHFLIYRKRVSPLLAVRQPAPSALRLCFADLQKINRKPELLETLVSHSKQRTVLPINRKLLSTSRVRLDSLTPHTLNPTPCPINRHTHLLEILVSYRKQRTDRILIATKTVVFPARLEKINRKHFNPEIATVRRSNGLPVSRFPFFLLTFPFSNDNRPLSEPPSRTFPRSAPITNHLSPLTAFRDLPRRRRIATLGGAMARQRLGQHFLGDPSWQKKIFKTLPHHADEAWIEIGAGHGEMTQLLAADAKQVVAIETDVRLAVGLRECAAQEWPNVEIVSADVLGLDLAKLTSGKFRVYGNLPYYITSPILHRLFDCADRIASIHIVIQLEVAERIVAPPGGHAHGYLSAACQYYTKPEIAMRIPPGAFRPPPKVKSALLRMTMPGERASLRVADDKRFLDFVQTCFGMKRKTLRNNLLALASDARIHAALAASGLRPDARAEQLTLAQFASLFRELA